MSETTTAYAGNIPWNKRRFRRIHTKGYLPDGRIITCTHSFPNGADINQYLDIDRKLMFTYGLASSISVEPMENINACS